MAFGLNIGSLLSSPPYIGLDVGAGSVKAVAVKNNTGKNPKVLGVGMAEMPHGAFVDGAIHDQAAVADTIHKALKDLGVEFRNAPVCVGLHGVNVVFKRCVMPMQNADEMGQNVLLEVQQQVDSDLNDWSVDYQVLTKPDASGQVVSVVVAAKKIAIDELILLLRKVGVLPTIFDCDVFAIENSYTRYDDKRYSGVLFVDIGKDSTKLHLLQGGVCLVARSLSIGGHMATDSIARALNCDHKQAEQVKLASAQAGRPANLEVARAMESHIMEVCEEIKRTIEFLASDSGGISQIAKVILSGGGASLPGLAQGISMAMGAEVIYQEPFKGMSIGGGGAEDMLDGMSHVFSVAVGLSLRYLGDKPK